MRAFILRAGAVLGGALLFLVSFGLVFAGGHVGFFVAAAGGALLMLVVSNVAVQHRFLIARYASLPALAVGAALWVDADFLITEENGVATMVTLALTCGAALHIGAWVGPKLK